MLPLFLSSLTLLDSPKGSIPQFTDEIRFTEVLVGSERECLDRLLGFRNPQLTCHDVVITDIVVKLDEALTKKPGLFVITKSMHVRVVLVILVGTSMHWW